MASDLDLLRAAPVFLATAQQLSFAGAARVLGITPSGVAKAVARLEVQLGHKLFHRTTRAMSLTEQGRDVYAACARMADEFDALQERLSRQRSEPEGLLRVAAPSAFAQFQLAPALQAFQASYPKVEIELLVSDALSNMAEEALDLLVRIAPITDSRLVFRRLARQFFVTCAAPDYLKRHGTPASPGDLALHDCALMVLPASGREMPWQFARGGKLQELSPNARLRSNNAEVLLRWTIAGAGIVQLPRYVVHDLLQCNHLVPLLTSWRSERVAISLGTQQLRRPLPKLRAAVDFLLDWAARNPAFDAP